MLRKKTLLCLYKFLKGGFILFLKCLNGQLNKMSGEYHFKTDVIIRFFVYLVRDQVETEIPSAHSYCLFLEN